MGDQTAMLEARKKYVCCCSPAVRNSFYRRARQQTNRSVPPSRSVFATLIPHAVCRGGSLESTNKRVPVNGLDSSDLPGRAREAFRLIFLVNGGSEGTPNFHREQGG